MISSNKLIILVLTIISILVGLIIYFFYKPFFSDRLFFKSQTDKKEITDKEKERILKLQEQVREIVKLNDFKKCDEIKDEYYKTVCINNIAFNLAKEKQDISYCQKLDNKLLYTEDCEIEILFSKALNKEDITVCFETKNEAIKKSCKDNFWRLLSLKKKDINLCENYLNDEEKIICRDLYTFKNEFLFKKSDIKSFNCLKFENKDIQDDCNFFKKNFSIIKVNLCHKLKSYLFRDYCLQPIF